MNEIILHQKPALILLQFIGGKTPAHCFDYRFNYNQVKKDRNGKKKLMEVNHQSFKEYIFKKEMKHILTSYKVRVLKLTRLI